MRLEGEGEKEGEGGGAITNDALKFGKIIEFESSWIVMNCQWIVYSYIKSV